VIIDGHHATPSTRVLAEDLSPHPITVIARKQGRPRIHLGASGEGPDPQDLGWVALAACLGGATLATCSISIFGADGAGAGLVTGISSSTIHEFMD
jgi:hypothetical protein